MKRYAPILLFVLLIPYPLVSQSLPVGYILQYQQNFSGSRALADFSFDDPASWGIFSDGKNYYLHCTANGTKATMPVNRAMISNKVFGDFILEADLMPGTDSSGFREACVILGYKDSASYYCVQLASRCDSLNHGVYLVKRAVITRLTDNDVPPVVWKDGKWHRVRIVRDIVQRTITVYVDDMKKPLLQAKNYEFVMGQVGVGTFGGAARFDNIKIWAPTVITKDIQQE